MKHFYNFFKGMASITAILALLTATASCSSEEVTGGSTVPESGKIGVKAIVPPLEFEGSRSSLVLGSSGMEFAWSDGDALTVYAHGNNEARQEYHIRDGVGTQEASFSSKDFSLTKGKRYYAVSMTETSSGHTAYLPDQTNITFNYGGQVQTGNASPAHLGRHDFLVASAVCEQDDYMLFHFQRLGMTLRVVVNLIDKDGGETDADYNAKKTAFQQTRFTSLEVYDSKDGLRQQIRPFTFSNCMSGSEFTATWADPDFMPMPVKDRFVLRFAGDGVKPTDAYQETTNTAKNQLIAYIELPPFDFGDGRCGFILRGKDAGDKDVTYYGIYDKALNLRMNKAVQVNLKVQETTNFDVTLKLNQNWQLGSAVTRSTTGDPGLDDKLDIPNYIYYILCVNGTVKAVNEKAVNSIVVDDTGTNKWTTAQTNGNTICTYGKKLTFQLTKEEAAQTKNLYVIASRTPLDEDDVFDGIFDGISAGTPESTVKALAYSIPGVATTNAPLDASQLFLRDLYSTPWNNEGNVFSGKIIERSQDVVLYHTAAKVDLMWDSPLALTGNIAVNNVNSEGLKFFTPISAGGSSASYTVSTPIIPETKYSGRQVFYLPQYNSYNGTIGTTNEPINFTPGTTNGYTSWLRWMKQY